MGGDKVNERVIDRERERERERERTERLIGANFESLDQMLDPGLIHGTWRL